MNERDVVMLPIKMVPIKWYRVELTEGIKTNKYINIYCEVRCRDLLKVLHENKLPDNYTGEAYAITVEDYLFYVPTDHPVVESLLKVEV